MLHVVLDTMCRVQGAAPELLGQAKKELSLPNPEYVRRKRMGQWTGKIRSSLTLFRIKGKDGAVLPRGYAGRFLSMARREGMDWDLEDRRISFGKKILTFQGELRPYQKEALEKMSVWESGVLSAPCGSGKTCMGLALAVHRGEPTLILVHTLDLLHQMQEDVQRWLGIVPGIVGGGKWKPQEDVTIATVQTLTRHKKGMASFARAFGTLILDEAHHVPATTFTKIIQKFPAKYRYGLSATPEREDGLHPFLFAVMGPLRNRVTSEDLALAGRLLRPRLHWILTDFFSPFAGGEEYTDLMGDLVRSDHRNALILKVASSCLEEGRCLLILSERVEHCDFFGRSLGSLFPGKVGCITGETPRKERGCILEQVRQGKLSCLVASRIADEGLDLPVLDALIFATPFRGKSKGWQRVGRVMRTFQGKKQPHVYDFLDYRVSTLRNQANGRYRDIYKNLVDNPVPPEILYSSRKEKMP